jgi:serine/threonine protein kinase/tetratricopeptide (TPR) repeat protein
MKVDPEAWPILSRLMDEWLDLPAEQRGEWLRNLEPEHANILPALRELLSQPNPGFLETLPPVAGEESGEPAAASVGEGILVGPYRLVRELGHGGMGVVWLATRSDGTLKRDVAIKFPHLYLHSQALADRFARERDILARLTDARIARLYDAGVTAQGQPYLVLEYIAGEPITVYCDRVRLDIRMRLKLFLEVLGAVQYAHTNLIVHRDLKPSNMLVTKAGEVRLLDFGIAKLLEEGEAQETEITRFGGRALTPDFASPEQLAGGAVTTATDVYSLGILLFELLTGGRPYKLRRDVSGGMAQDIWTTEPARPSQFLKEESRALARGITVKKLNAELRGDLDTIVLKAIQKKPTARYATADAFAQDIERHLSGLPVLARPENAWYRTKKFVLRNKLAVASAVAIALALTAGGGVALWQKNRADTEAATARAVSEFLQTDLLSQAGASTGVRPGATFDPDIKVRTALDRAAARLAGKFGPQPAVEAAIRQTIGNTYIDLGLYVQAAQQMERALELRRRAAGPDDPQTLTTQQHLAEVYRADGKYAQAEPMLSNLVEIARRNRRENAREVIAAKVSLAEIAYGWHGDYARAETLYSPLVETARRVLGETDPLTLEAMNNFAVVFSKEGKFAQAEELYKRVVEIKRRVLGADHPDTLGSINGLGVLYMAEGKYPEAEAQLKIALDGGRRIRGEQHRETLWTMTNLGQLYAIQGKYAEAEDLLPNVVKNLRQLLGEDKPETLNSMGVLANFYLRENQLKKAETVLEEAVAVERRASILDTAVGRGHLLALGKVKVQEHAYAEAEPLLRQAVYGYGHTETWAAYWAKCVLGASLAGQGKNLEAESLLTSGCRSLLQRRDSIPLAYRYVLDDARQWTESDKARPRRGFPPAR